MGKILNAIIVALIIATGVYSASVCIEYLGRKSDKRGEATIAQKIELEDNNKDYSITYDLNSGRASNPEKYNLFTSTFSLNNPTRENYRFIGWTGSNVDTPQLSVTICKGSSGDLSFTANFALILDAPTLTADNGVIFWNEVVGATGYKVNVNGIDIQNTISATSTPLYTIKNYCKPGINIVKVKAIGDEDNNNTITVVDGPYSNSVNYSVTQLETPNVSASGFIIRWDAIDLAISYKVNIGVNSVEVTETSLNVLNYIDLFSITQITNIRVQAISDTESTVLNSNLSENIAYARPTLDQISFSLNNEILSWNFDNKVAEYKVYVNGILAENYTGNPEINLALYASEFITGTNAIKVIASALGYNNAEGIYNFEYVRPDSVEGVELHIFMERYVNSWTIYNGAYLSVNRSNLSVTEMYVDHQFYEQGLSVTETFLKHINPTEFEVNLNDCTLGEIALLIDNSYEQGMSSNIINASGKFKFTMHNIVLNEYVPQTIYIRCEFGEMYVEPSLNDNEIILNYNNNGISTLYYYYGYYYTSFSDRYLSTLFQVSFCTKNNTRFDLHYEKIGNNAEQYKLILRSDNRELYSLNEINQVFSNAEFRINDSFYIKVKIPIEDFISEITSTLYQERVEYCENSTQQYPYDSFLIYDEYILNRFIDVYSNDGIKINTTCLFKIDYQSCVP